MRLGELASQDASEEAQLTGKAGRREDAGETPGTPGPPAGHQVQAFERGTGAGSAPECPEHERRIVADDMEVAVLGNAELELTRARLDGVTNILPAREIHR